MQKKFVRPSSLSPTAPAWEQRNSIQSPLKEYEDNMLLVSGVKNTITKDALWILLNQHIGEVKRITFLQNERVVIFLYKPTDISDVCLKINGLQLTVERILLCDSVRVIGLLSQTTRVTIASYFGDVRQSGGGTVESVILDEWNHCAVVVFEDPQVAENVANSRHFVDGSHLSVEKYYPQIDGPITDTKGLRIDKQHKDLISQFIRHRPYPVELNVQLQRLLANINWVPSSCLSRIWEMADPEFLNDWAKSYQMVVGEFLAQFEIITFRFEESLGNAIGEALPRLHEVLGAPDQTAIGAVSKNQPELLVVCLKREKECISEIVYDFIKVVKKETLTKETLKVASQAHITLLTNTGFIKGFKTSHANVNVSFNDIKCEMYLEGPREYVSVAKSEWESNVARIVHETVLLPYTTIGKVVKSEMGNKFLMDKMVSQNISAVFYPKKGNGISLMATTSAEFEKAKKCLKEAMKRCKVDLGGENRFVLESEKWKTLHRRLDQKELVEITIDTSTWSIVLVGFSETFEKTKDEIEKFAEMEKLRYENVQIPWGMLQYLKMNLWHRVESIEHDLKKIKMHVSISISESSPSLLLKGTPEGLARCRTLLKELCSTIVRSEVEYPSPGLAKLFSEENGKRHLEKVQTEKKVFIEVVEAKEERMGKVRHGDTTDGAGTVSGVRSGQKKIRLNSMGLTSDSASVYDNCNFCTKEGISVSLKFGNIAEEKADILVNSANQNLKHLTTFGKAFEEVVGNLFVEDCASIASPPGTVVHTFGGGNLKCIHVLHAVCCKWDYGRGEAEKTLRCLIHEVLETSVKYNASSLAIPTIGTHDHKFPETEVLRILREEIVTFSWKKPFTKLRRIQIVVSDEARDCPSSALGFRSISFGSVRVSVHLGDITKHSADAVINLLPCDYQLVKGGDVCKSILKAGGKEIQEQVSRVRLNSSRDSILVTHAGFMKNTKNILHFIPRNFPIDLQGSIEKCFKKAKNLSIQSVAVAAIGTKSLHIPPRDLLDLILDAAKHFSIADYLLDVNIVVYRKTMLSDFETVIQNRSRLECRAMSPPPTGEASSPGNQSSCPEPEVFAPPEQQTPGPIRIKLAKPQMITKVYAYGHSQQDIKKSLEEVNKFACDNTGTQKLEAVNVGHLLLKHPSKVEELELTYDVSITCLPPSVVTVYGILSSISACMSELHSFINEYGTEVRSRTEQVVSTVAVPKLHEEDKMLLTPQQIKDLSTVVRGKWIRLARLLNMRCDILTDIQAKCQDNYSDARPFFEQFNLLHAKYPECFSLNNLIKSITELPLKLPKSILVLETRNSFESTGAQPLSATDGKCISQQDNLEISTVNENPECYKVQVADEDDPILDTTPLSLREIERLSREIAVIWTQLAGLLNLQQGDIENIRLSLQYIQPTDKAVQFLQLYNNNPSFSRNDLADFLDELRYLELSEKFRSGILRKRVIPETQTE